MDVEQRRYWRALGTDKERLTFERLSRVEKTAAVKAADPKLKAKMDLDPYGR